MIMGADILRYASQQPHGPHVQGGGGGELCPSPIVNVLPFT